MRMGYLMKHEKLKIQALRSFQGENAIFSFFIDGKDIFEIADISRISGMNLEG